MTEEIIQEKPKEKKDISKKATVIIWVVCLMLIAAMIFSFVYFSDKHVIKRLVEEEIRDSLLYNSEEAKFSGMSDTDIEIDGLRDSATVSGFVNAFNAYGTSTKAKYEAEVSKDSDGEWVVDNATLDDGTEDFEW